MSGKPFTTPRTAPPRLSASLIIINHRNDVLLVHRNPEARSFGGVHVFPGGKHDPRQDASLQITGIRETFEETGLLLASPDYLASSIPQHEWDKGRHAILAQKLSFGEFMNSHGLKPAVDLLLNFTAWTSPEYLPRRFRTQFFVAFLPSPSSGFPRDTKQEWLPTSDGQEIVSARFLHPSEALLEFQRKQITLMPPQYYILYTLSNLLSGRVNTKEQRDQVEALSRGAFGDLSICPKLWNGESKQDKVVLTYEEDETRGGPPGRLHRSLVKPDKRGACSEIELQRNFDIFKDLKLESGLARL
ncbi:hypothetical protein AX14_013463 [Amanita brunnescens Koide BX004]|nr:hypothetical protein AX14_013463 [Amanita brunnescens Koide BX004]